MLIIMVHPMHADTHACLCLALATTCIYLSSCITIVYTTTSRNGTCDVRDSRIKGTVGVHCTRVIVQSYTFKKPKFGLR